MRPPEVFVRELSPEEGARLKSISRRAKYQSKRQRALILLASSTRMSAPQIAAVVRTDESHVRKVIHAFNQEGFGSLDPDYRAKPDDGVVVCFDEMGPIGLIPHDGSGWAPEKLPERLRATYSKNNGVRYLLGAYDVHGDRLHGRLRAQERRRGARLLPPDPHAL